MTSTFHKRTSVRMRGGVCMYKDQEIAKYVIRFCNDRNYSISNLKLQKILYFIQAEFLIETEQPCFEDRIEAWDFGPVVPNVYFEYRVYGGSNIPCTTTSQMIRTFSRRVRELIDGIVDQCAQYSASTLVDITHSQSPWIDAYNRPGHNNPITNESIIEYFKQVSTVD